MPKEEVAVMLLVDWEVSRSCDQLWTRRPSARSISYPACILRRGPSGAPGRECTKKSDAEIASTIGSHNEATLSNAVPTMGHEHDRGGRSIGFICAQERLDFCDYRNKGINLVRDKGTSKVSMLTIVRARSVVCWMLVTGQLRQFRVRARLFVMRLSQWFHIASWS